MKCMIFAGELSGDLIGAELCRDMLTIAPDTQVLGWGGKAMSSAGCELLHETTDAASMGFAEILMAIPKYLQLLAEAKKDITAHQPDVIVLIDQAGFHMRLLPWIKKQGIKVVYLIPPKTWASRASREDKLRKYCDGIIVGYEFEKEHFSSKGISTQYYGHPYLRPIEDAQQPQVNHIAILPGSRKQEVNRILPIIADVIAQNTYYQWHISVAPSVDIKTFSILDKTSIHFHREPINEWIGKCSAAIVTSGTVSVEVVLAKTPQVVTYRMHPLTYQIAKRIITTKYISLPNLMLDRQYITELIQNDCTAKNITAELSSLTSGRHQQDETFFNRIASSVQRNAPFSRAAQDVINLMRQD